jgi:hypothetical protein
LLQTTLRNFLLLGLGPPPQQQIRHRQNVNCTVLYFKGFAGGDNTLCKVNTQTSFIKVLMSAAEWP